tara:strand:- start:3763 stop:4257 length:495 start_codon:yes stop_codon:yes gene_type:complete
MKTIERHRYRDKEIFQTRTLIFEPYPMTEIESVIGLIRDNLSPDLLKGRKSLMYPDDVLTNKYYGHCYHSSQALHYLMDSDILYPMSAEDYRGEKHWWLSDGNINYDITADQYYSVGQAPPHLEGKKTSWYGWKQRPQQVSLNLVVRVLGNKLVSDKITDMVKE